MPLLHFPCRLGRQWLWIQKYPPRQQTPGSDIKINSESALDQLHCSNFPGVQRTNGPHCGGRDNILQCNVWRSFDFLVHFNLLGYQLNFVSFTRPMNLCERMTVLLSKLEFSMCRFT
jgi:hypothetical protein